jgi:hypothetical protein
MDPNRPKSPQTQEKLAAALRENLQKRKQQARAKAHDNQSKD